MALNQDLLIPIAVAAASLLLGIALAFAIPCMKIRSKRALAEQLRDCRADLFALLQKNNCAPLLVRLAWHDSGTYNGYVDEWPLCGGANGSIRFAPEINHGANAGLQKGLDILRPIKEKHPSVSWADLMQMASAVAVEHCGGPRIPMVYGRRDVASPEQCAQEGNLPGAKAPFGDGAKDAPTHLRRVFYRMGFNDQEIVALSGAHTLGRAFKDRSGVCPFESGGQGTKFTCPGAKGLTGENYMPGGQSWTENWLQFDNSYFKPSKHDLLRLPTDTCLKEDEDFKPYAALYAEDASAFARDYAEAHKKLSELGSLFAPPEGIRI
mmetsp:Transcript_9793/g.16336  ORF Transcript_9793/g.16336 Transcript_9793/m.16336 type:complete len:323 (-) Transcript_9793:426-1394(-)